MFFVILGLPTLPSGWWLVRSTFAVCSSHVRPVNKCRRVIWNAPMTYKHIRPMPYFYHAEYANLVWSVYILLAILRWRNSGFGTPLLLVQYNIDRVQKKPVSTILICGKEITQKMCACSLLHLEIYDIRRGSMENTVSDTDALWWRVATLQEQTDLHYKNIAFWVDLLLPWVNLFLPWAICFCREWFASAVTVKCIPRTYM